MPAVALTIAGSDPSGGAGIQADLKTFHQFGVYGQAVVTLLTVQNTQSVYQVHMLAPALVADQIQAVVSDMPPGAVKTGALGSAEIAEAVAHWARSSAVPLIVDPVMLSKHGVALLSTGAQYVVKHHLLPLAAVVAPNIPEAELLTGRPIRTEDEMIAAARDMLDLGCKAVIVKGGHREGEPLDIFHDEAGVLRLPGRRVQTRHTHGTGCTFSAAITAAMALGANAREAARRAKGFVQRAIESAPELGGGQGPLNHFAET
jgi:hydroxymethylpyrimidine/phosphomethylpyrimidine kinase